MATAAGGRDPYESVRAGEKLRKRPFPTEITEDPQYVSQEAAQNNSTVDSELNTGGDFASFSATIGIPELEQIMKHKTFTRSEAHRVIALVHSRTMEELPSPVIRLEASTTSGSLKKHKHGDERDNFHAAAFSSRIIVEEEIASLAEFAKAYRGSTTCLSKTPMASSKQPATMENLPEELLLNIFIRLLAKQLAQMRSVKKSWNAILSEPSFIKSHLHRSIHNNDQFLLLFHGEETSSPGFKPFTTKSCQSPSLELTNFIKLPVNLQPEYTSGVKVIGSVNGLICSSYNNDSVIQIWNPSLCAELTLPSYSTPSHVIRSFLRFGFDPKTDDYKVVKLTGLTNPSTFGFKRWLQIEIYSMRKGIWEVITERFPSHIRGIVNHEYLCADGHDGHLHWLCRTGETMHSKAIAAFDLGLETFREIPLPASALDHNRENVLGFLTGKLCVMSQDEDEDVGCEVWVMEEYGVAESWVKRHVFSPFIGETCVFGFTSHSVFIAEDAGYLVMYDPSTNERKVLENHCPKYYGVHNIVEYVDSLVWVAPRNCG